MEKLIKKRYTGRGSGDKYYVDCSQYAENSESLEMKNLLKNTKKPDVAILKALATNETIKKKNRHIVVKISRTKVDASKEYMAIKEYRIGESLKNISGFIQYICLFACFDDTNTKFDSINAGENPIPVETKICSATEKIDENWKYVLVMPYIQEGSLESHNWTSNNVELLKNLMIHTILSLINAFETVGFVHNDLHWGNILFKRTKMKEIQYEFTNNKQMTFQTMGYKVVIMDFEKSYIGENNPVLLWVNLLTFFQKIAGLQNENNEMIIWYNKKVISMIENMINKKMSVDNNNIVKLIKLINDSNIEFVDIRP